MGDFDGDGYDDAAIGVLYEDRTGGLIDTGAVHILYGSSAGFRNDASHNQVLSRASYFGTNGRGDHFGESLAAGDFNGDGYPDLAVGHPFEPVDGKSRAGAVSVIFGDSGDLPTHGRRQVWHQGRAHVPGDPETHDAFGWSLAAADFDNDGIDDLAIGIPFEDIRGTIFTKTDAGAVLVLYGSYGGLYVGADADHPSDFNEEKYTFVYDVTKTVIGEDEISVGLSSYDEFGTALSVLDFFDMGYPSL